jgi:hypothetical protein
VSLSISGAVEGPIDDAVVRRLIRDTEHEVDSIYFRNGKAGLLERLPGYNAAARLKPWLVLIDLNGDAECAASFIVEKLPSPAQQMLFRVAVRQIESWVLADREKVARFLRISQALVPRDPDSLENAKRALVNLARRSSSRAIQQDMVPTTGSARKVGVAYTARMIEFIEGAWSPDGAKSQSDSLRRCLDRLQEL